MAVTHYEFPIVRTIRGGDLHKLDVDERGAVLILKDAGALILAPELLPLIWHARELRRTQAFGRVEARQIRVHIPLEPVPQRPRPSCWSTLRGRVQEWWLPALCAAAVFAMYAWALAEMAKAWGTR